MRKDYSINIEGLDLIIEYENKADNDRGMESAFKSSAMRAVQEKSGMNRKDFAEWLKIPYRTISDWECGLRKMPDYVLNLIAYKVRMEIVEGGENE